MHMNNKDLNLLPVFEALAEERNVSKAAKRLRLSQSAVSHALQRLRDMFGDPLFVRSSRGVVPTPKAVELAPRLHEALAALEAVLADAGEATPASYRGRMVLAGTEYIEQLCLPGVLPRLCQEAPQMVLQSISTQGHLPKEAMERGEVDLAIAGFFGDLPEGFYQQKIFEDGFSCVVKKNHPLIKGELTLESYLAADHLLISPQGDLHGVVDKLLAKKGKKRKIVAGLASFMSPGWIVADSNLIVTVPTRLADYYARALGTRTLPVPIAVPKITVVQVWHERTHRSAKHRWFRSLIHDHFTPTT